MALRRTDHLVDDHSGAGTEGRGQAPLGPAPPKPRPADIERCRRCDLWRDATHGVPGEGPLRGPLMLVGEQPGDAEDRAGRPFVGPAGGVLAQVLGAVGTARAEVYVTNAVKHFKWEPRGKRRLHRRPNVAEIEACHHWLEMEIAAVQPPVILALGATAARSLLRRTGSIESLRGKAYRHASGAWVYVTYHPAAVLRAQDDAARLQRLLLGDLRRAIRRFEESPRRG